MIFRSLVKVFRNPSYLAGAFFVALILFSIFILFPSFELISNIYSNFGLVKAVKISFSLAVHFGANQSFLSATYISLVAILFGLNVSLIVYHLKLQKARLGGRDAAKSSAGLILGLLGVGCASCGSLILVTLFSFIGAGGILIYFPLHGQEFGILAVLILLYSNYSVLKKIDAPLIC